MHCRAVNSKWTLNLQIPVYLLLSVLPSCHFKLAWMLFCVMFGPECVLAVTVLPVVFQCGLQYSEFLQWHSSGAVSSYFFQWCSSVPCKYSLDRPVVYASVHWVNQWHSSGIPVYTNVHWPWVSDLSFFHQYIVACFICSYIVSPVCLWRFWLTIHMPDYFISHISWSRRFNFPVHKPNNFLGVASELNTTNSIKGET